MAISRIPGYSLLANLDRQGTDLSLTSNGQTLVYFDVTNYRVGINTGTSINPADVFEVNGNILISNGNVYSGANLSYDLGAYNHYWRTVYSGNVYGTILTADQPYITNVGVLSNLTVAGNLTVNGDIVLGNVILTANASLDAGNNRIINVASPVANTDAANKQYVDSAVSAYAYANAIQLGTPADGNITSPGAWGYWAYTTPVTTAIDDLNEMMENVRANTFVKSVTFTANTTAGGAGTLVQLTIVPTGTATLYDINWGDGLYSNATSSTTPTHPYTTNVGSPYTVIVRAYGAGAGTGSEASLTRTAYIIIYTADPNVQFDLYRASSGGSALTGNNLYVIEGNTIYLQNTTTNTTMATVAYQMNWGDGTGNTAIANDSASGGVLGSRLAYTPSYTASSGATTNTFRLFLTSHTTANPSVIPTANIANVKVYDANISSPATLNTKGLTFSVSVGFNPTLASGAIDNTGGTALAANASVSRTLATGTTLITTGGNVSTSYSYNANVGYLQAVVNGTVRGNVNMATQTTPVITGNLGVIGFSDFWLLTSSGVGTTFSSSVYYPGAFWGFVANIVAQGGSIPVGINRFGMNSTNGGIVANIEFVKDDVTASPTVSGGNVAIRAPGTYRYISGVPYFNTGNPQLWLQDLTISSWIGQSWNNTANVVAVNTGTVLEGSGNVILANTHAYVHLSNVASPMLASGTPIAGTGNVTAYNLGNLTVAVNQASVRAVANIQIVATNVNGTSTARNVNTRRIQVHTAAQSGISEISISANVSGNTNPGVRSTYFLASTTHNPSYVNTTNFMSSGNVYTESSDPGVAGTREATIRIGVLRFDASDYGNVFLPVGPNRSNDGTSYQYFTFGFQRTATAQFNLHLVAPSGVANVWIAAPGTTIDNTSGLNGWLRCDTTYAGSGVPGVNTGSGGNGSDGVAFTSGDRILANTALSGTFKMTLGTENLTNATNNVCLVRIALVSGQTVTTLAVS